MPNIRQLVLSSLMLSIASIAHAGKPAAAPGCAAQPIIFVHGYAGSPSNWNAIEDRMLKEGQPSCAMFKFSYNSLGDSNVVSAKKLSDYVNQALTATGQSKVKLLAHSNGGLVARWYRVFEGGSAKTSRFMSLASPHQGTTWAYGCLSAACFEMRPNSSFLQDLAGRGCEVSLWSDADEIILPNSSAQCGQSIRTASVSHNGVFADDRVYADIKANF